MDFLLSINRKYFPNLDNNWIQLFLANDIYSKISGCEIYIDFCDLEGKTYLSNLLRENIAPHWKFQFHAPDLDTLNNNYLNLLEYYDELSQILGYRIRVNFHPIASNISISDNISKTKDELCKILNIIEKRKFNIDILIENLDKTLGNQRCNLHELDEIIDMKNVGLTWDIGHEVKDNNCDYLLGEKFVTKLENIHLHDILDTDHHPFYYGKTDLKKCFKYLNEIGFNGTVVSEIALDFYKCSNFQESVLETIKNIYILSYYQQSTKE